MSAHTTSNLDLFFANPQEVDPEYSLNTYSRATSIAGGIIGLDQIAYYPPRDDSLHLAQKTLTPRLLMVNLKANISKGNLTHGNHADGLNQIQSDLPKSVN